MCRADGRCSSSGGGLDRALSQVIDGTRQSASSLDEQFEPLILKGICVDADGPKPRSDVVTGFGQAQAE